MKDSKKLPPPAVLTGWGRFDGVRNPMLELPGSLPPVHEAIAHLNGGEVKHGTLAKALIEGADHEIVYLPGVTEFGITVKHLREFVLKLFGLTPKAFSQQSAKKQDRIADRVTRKVRRAIAKQLPKADDEKMAAERGRVHDKLKTWARGVLGFERPAGSSLHHLVEYDRRCSRGAFDPENLQPIVVQHEWAKIVPPDGVWRLPFPECCWEFRISGVRVLAVTVIDDGCEHEGADMILVYGYDGHWVCDDLVYTITPEGVLKIASSRKHPVPQGATPHSFRRVVDMVHANIRASCIMMDAGICRREHVAPPPGLAKKRAAEGRAAPRGHSVVQLAREYRMARVARAPNGATTERSPQRGHWRRGTWVHYDDPDSGEETYANDGGFFVSKTWRRYHFAGDPDNLIDREYHI